MRWKLYVGILAVFLLGGVAGVMVGAQYERTTRERMNAERARKSAVDFFSRRMGHELGLDAEQLAKIRAILEEVQPEIHKLEEARREGVQRIMDSTHPRMLAILDEEQKRKFLEMQERVRKHLERKYKWREPAPGNRDHGPPGRRDNGGSPPGPRGDPPPFPPGE